jgi:hypothetical protein
MNFFRYAWGKRAKWWSKRDVAVAMVGRELIRAQYRLAGLLASLAKALAPAAPVAPDTVPVDAQPLKKAANPFIEYEIGRLRLKSAQFPRRSGRHTPSAMRMSSSRRSCGPDSPLPVVTCLQCGIWKLAVITLSRHPQRTSSIAHGEVGAISLRQTLALPGG